MGRKLHETLFQFCVISFYFLCFEFQGLKIGLTEKTSDSKKLKTEDGVSQK